MYGNPKALRIIHRINGIVEIPPSTFRILGINIPFSGGIYFRILPYGIIKYFIRRLRKKCNQPIIMYFHPWELDPKLVKIRKISPLYKFVLYHNTKNSMKKFRKLINDFDFTSIEEYSEISV
ncbi:DUF3473 domain-containing protein [Robiginitalea sp. 2V75]|uniref:DUF3473 domain-containing protein n=2 Tax=Robiginitalea marina TaxID=2954105 RepID=A0ABT1AZQ8_9FLAO|nr:DUF3473 domain-containing protein [Robiginitalea marina]